jgi:hypothetical protein
VTRPVDLVSERLDIRGNLGLQRYGQHLPGTIADRFVEQRPAHRGRGVLVRLGLPWTTLSTGVPSRTSAPTPVLIRAIGLQIISGRCAPSRHPAEGHPQVLIIAHGRIEIVEGRHLKKPAQGTSRP